ncbi:amino acid adenylation domain-containing protein [Streptomyces sp. NPDC052396]|uniref:amino acid adenylation domain-containing protein n=1 Tax=Streptomyces sp. NPDC052396 TaxID=3365689 RepID=UPI0037CDF85E
MKTIRATDQQREVWLASGFGDAAGRAYVCPISLELTGPLDVTALVEAVDALVERHESLRSSFHDGTEVRVHHGLVVNVPLVDLAHYAPDRQHAMVREWYAAERQRVFDLERAPLLRCTLLRLGEQRHHLVITHHHIVADGWGGDVLLRDLGSLYRARHHGKDDDLPPAPGLAAHSQRQAARAESAAFAAERAYWEGKFSDGFPEFRIPPDEPRPTADAGEAGHMRIPLPEGLVQDLRRLSARHSATLYMTMLAAFRVFASRVSGVDDLVIGSSYLNRGSAEERELVAHCANVLCLRTPVYDPRQRFDALLEAVRTEVLGANEHAGYPLQRLTEGLRAQEPRRSKLVTTVFNMEREGIPADFGPGIQARPVSMDALPGTPFDFTLTAVQTGREVSLDLIYDGGVYSSATARRWLEQYRTLLAAVAEDPAGRLGRLPMMSQDERRTVTLDWNRTERDIPQDRCLHHLVSEHAARTPDAPAVVSAAGTLSYAQLDTAANRLAGRLLAQGVTPDRTVAVCLPRRPELIVALLAVLKAGAGYLPLDAAYPAARLTHMLQDSGTSVVITRRGILPDAVTAGRTIVEPGQQGEEGDRLPSQAPEVDVRPENLAYVLYTSGSTGTPKGTMTSHRSVIRLVFGLDGPQLGPDRRILAAAPVTFDASTFEIWGALAHGAACVLHGDTVPDYHSLFATIRDHQVDTAWLTSALFNGIVDSGPEEWRPLRRLLVGGEALSPGHVRRALARLPETTLINGYGPTESTTFACCYEIPRDLPAEATAVPIGRPIGHTRAYVLDADLRPVPVGVRGELYVAGYGLARGYLGRSALTAERFLPDPFGPPGGRLYRTGDLARWDAQGNLHYLGRADQQLKIRGHRIEPGEIEAVLRRHPTVRDAVVIACETGPGDRELAAYVVPREGRSPSEEELGEFLRATLPDYLCPSRIISLDAFPLTANGKLDRAALPGPSRQEVPAEPAPDQRTATEERLAALWAEVMKRDDIGLDTDFFEIGGHSLRATQIVSRIRRTFAVKFPIPAFFDAPSIRAQAKIIDTLLQEASVDR